MLVVQRGCGLEINNRMISSVEIDNQVLEGKGTPWSEEMSRHKIHICTSGESTVRITTFSVIWLLTFPSLQGK